MSNLEIRGHQVGFSEDPNNAAEGMYLDCSRCELTTENPNLPLSCERGLRVSFGIAICGSSSSVLRKHDDDSWQAVDGIRSGAKIEGVQNGGVLLSYDQDGLLLNSQYRVKPNRAQRFLAKIGIDRVVWNPQDI